VSLFLSKGLSLLIHPLSLGLLVVGGGASIAGWWRRIGLGVVCLGVLVVWVPATDLFADWIRGTLESRYPPAPAEALPTADAIVVLGGGIGVARPPRVYPDLGDASDRVRHAARLYHAGKAPVIIVSGGTLPWRDRHFREASAMRHLLKSWNVPADSVILESSSANTYENAKWTAGLAAERGIDRVLLITSAFHMRRALATFRRVQMNAIPAATDYRVGKKHGTLLDLLPSARALAESTTAIREYVGYWVYDWRGWIAGVRESIRRRSPASAGIHVSQFPSHTLVG
jgi:uncharacterized SAM-binding protein YcdF (DUF218 family)